jgi:hypothetical protein
VGPENFMQLVPRSWEMVLMLSNFMLLVLRYLWFFHTVNEPRPWWWMPGNFMPLVPWSPCCWCWVPLCGWCQDPIAWWKVLITSCGWYHKGLGQVMYSTAAILQNDVPGEVSYRIETSLFLWEALNTVAGATPLVPPERGGGLFIYLPSSLSRSLARSGLGV